MADNHKTSRDANTRLQGRMGLRSTDSSNQLRPCANGSLCVVLVRAAATPHHTRYSAKSGSKNLSAALGAFSAELIIPKCGEKRKRGCGITWPPP
jgi:hypothetical protein